MRFKNAHVVVTGASRGIGRALAIEATRRGASVTGVARDQQALEKLTQENPQFHSYPADLTDRDQLNTVISGIEDQVGPVDVLINNAGHTQPGMVIDLSADHLTSVFDLNAVAPAVLSRHVLPGMLFRGRGAVVNISSVAGLAVFPGLGSYSSSKTALSVFTGALQRELHDTPVQVTLAILGTIRETDLMEQILQQPELEANYARMRRLGFAPTVTAKQAACAILDDTEKGRNHTNVPRRIAPLFHLAQLPTRIIDALTATPIRATHPLQQREARQGAA